MQSFQTTSFLKSLELKNFKLFMVYYLAVSKIMFIFAVANGEKSV